MSRGKSHISSFLWRNQQAFQAEVEKLKLVESVLDGLIKSCSQQLFEVTDNLENAAYPFWVAPGGAAPPVRAWTSASSPVGVLNLLNAGLRVPGRHQPAEGFPAADGGGGQSS